MLPCLSRLEHHSNTPQCEAVYKFHAYLRFPHHKLNYNMASWGPSSRPYIPDTWWESFGPGEHARPPASDMRLVDYSDWRDGPPLLRDRSFPSIWLWPKCQCGNPSVVQWFDHVHEGFTGRRFYRCQDYNVSIWPIYPQRSRALLTLHFKSQIPDVTCGWTMWMDEPYPSAAYFYIASLHAKIDRLKSRLRALQTSAGQTTQQRPQRRRHQPPATAEPSNRMVHDQQYIPSRVCSDTSCLCGCHYPTTPNAEVLRRRSVMQQEYPGYFDRDWESTSRCSATWCSCECHNPFTQSWPST